jgi:RNA polymerase sigma-70 factor (ECF subfamily)
MKPAPQATLSDTIHSEELAIAAKTDEAAFSKLYEMYLPKIFAYVTRRIADRDEAEDIVSNIFLRVVSHIKNFDPQKSSFKSWIYTITTHMMIDYFRTHGKRKHEELEAAEQVVDSAKNPAESAKTTQEKEKIHRVINRLPERHQKVIMLKYFSDLSLPEIAEALNITPNNAGVMVHRALEAFELAYHHYV